MHYWTHTFKASHNLSDPNPHYVPRPTLVYEIASALANTHAVVICGPGGFGKSQIAKAYAHEGIHLGKYMFTWHINANSDTELKLSYRQLAARFNLDIDKAALPDIIKRVHSCICNDEGLGDWLLVYDDFKNEESIYSLLSEGFPQPRPGTTGHVMITSRWQTWGRIAAVQADVYTDDEAESYVGKLLTAITEHDNQLLCREMGKHPLALSQTVGYILRSKKPVIDFIADFKESKALRLVRNRKHTDDYIDTVDGIVELAMKETDATCPFARVLLEHIAVAAAAPIRLSVLEALTNELQSMNSFTESIKISEELGLLLKITEQGIVKYQMHPLTSQAIYCLNSSCLLNINWMKVLNAFFSQSLTAPNVKRLCEELIPNVEKLCLKDHLCHDLCHNNMTARCAYVTGIRIQELGDYFLSENLFIMSLELYLRKPGTEIRQIALATEALGLSKYYQGHYNNALIIFQESFLLQIKFLSHFEVNFANCVISIASTYSALGKNNLALKLLHFALGILEQHVSKNQQHLATALNNIGNIFTTLGDYNAAIICLSQSHSILEQVFGAGHFKLVPTIVNIGSVKSIMGKFSEAIHLYEKALNIFQNVMGNEHFIIANILNFIGESHISLGNFQIALDTYEKALKIFRKKHLCDHIEVANIYLSIGDVFYKMGKYYEALDYYYRTLAMQINILGTEHASVATTYNNIGIVKKLLGNFDDALNMFSEALTIRRSSFGDKHAKVAVTMGCIGSVYTILGNHDIALKMLEESYAIFIYQYGYNHVDTAKLVGRIGHVHLTTGNLSLALEKYQQAHSILIGVLGKQHVDVLSSSISIGQIYIFQGDFRKALDIGVKTFTATQHTFGNDYIAAIALAIIGRAHCGLKNYTTALDNLIESRRQLTAVLNTESMDIIFVSLWIAQVYNSQGIFKNALEMYEYVKPRLKQPQSYKICLTEMADIYVENLQQFDKGLDLYHELLRFQKEELGANHVQLFVTYQKIAGIYIIQGNYHGYMKTTDEFNRIRTANHDYKPERRNIHVDHCAHTTCSNAMLAHNSFKDIMNMAFEIHGAHQAPTIIFLTHMRDAFRWSGNRMKAIHFAVKLEEVLSEVHGASHFLTVEARSIASSICRQ